MLLEGGHLLERSMSEFSGTREKFYILFEVMSSWVEAFVKNPQTTLIICAYHCMYIIP